jgi:cytoskeletal protein RodZ
MATVGEQLRRRREQAGMTLSEVAAHTKIPRWILSDVERGDLARIPGGVYIRGYITSFARALNLDGEKLWTEYLAESNSIPEPVSPSPPPVTDSTIPRWSFVSAGAIVLVAGTFAYYATRHHADAVVPPSEPQPVATTEVERAPTASEPIAEPVVAVDAPAPEPPARAAAKPTRPRRRVAERAATVVTATNEEPTPSAPTQSTEAAPAVENQQAN